MKIGICHAHHIPLAHVELAAAIVAAGHEPVVIGGPFEQPPSREDAYAILTDALAFDMHYREVFQNIRHDTGVVRNPALPKRPVNNGGSRYF